MKLYGYPQSPAPEAELPLLLSEVTLLADPVALRKIARFLESAAEEMESNPAQFEHVHLCDVDADFAAAPSFIVFNPLAI